MVDERHATIHRSLDGWRWGTLALSGRRPIVEPVPLDPVHAPSPAAWLTDGGDLVQHRILARRSRGRALSPGRETPTRGRASGGDGAGGGGDNGCQGAGRMVRVKLSIDILLHGRHQTASRLVGDGSPVPSRVTEPVVPGRWRARCTASHARRPAALLGNGAERDSVEAVVIVDCATKAVEVFRLAGASYETVSAGKDGWTPVPALGIEMRATGQEGKPRLLIRIEGDAVTEATV